MYNKHDNFLFNFSVCGESEVLDILINAKADPNTPDIHGAYPIHYAAQMCDPNCEMGHDIKVGLSGKRENLFGIVFLKCSFCSNSNFFSVLRKLLSHKVDITIFDHDGRQPLMWAASAGMYFF